MSTKSGTSQTAKVKSGIANKLTILDIGDNYWLGKVVKIHTIGDIDIVEYKSFSEDSESIYERKSSFSVYVAGRTQSVTYHTLDHAVLHGIAAHGDLGCNGHSEFAIMAARAAGLRGAF